MRTVTVSAPLCAPSREHLTGLVRRQLGAYGFKLGAVTATEIKQGRTPLWWEIRVDFTDKSAKWGEYVLLRFAYHREGRYLERKNEAWAMKYLGLRPQTGPWWHPGCHDKPKDAPPGEIGNANPPPPWGGWQQQRQSLWSLLDEAMSL